MIHHIVRNQIWQCLFIFTLLFTFNVTTQAVVPDNVDYQGYLTDSGGSPINDTVSITFSLYNIDTGGIALWSDTQPVTLTNGLFNTKLGRVGNPFPLGLFDAPLWLGIDVASDGEMAPRIAFSSAAFAHKADDALTLDGQSAASLDQSAHVANTSNPHSVTAAQAGAVTSANFSLHTGNANAHHTKTSTFTELSGQASNAQIPAAIARDSEIMPTVFANDGPGSRLNADLLDGLSSAAFMSAGTDNWVNITGDTMTGNLNVLARVGIGTTAPAYSLDVRGGVSNNLGYINNDNNGTGNAYGLYVSADARDTTTGLGRGAYFRGFGGTTSGTAYGSMHYAYAYGASTAYGVYSDADGGTTTGPEWAFYGLGDAYVSGNVGIGTNDPSNKLTVVGDVYGPLGYFYNNSTSGGSPDGLQAQSVAYSAGTGNARGGVFVATAGSTSGTSTGVLAVSNSYGTSTAYGVYSVAGGSTTGPKFAFYGGGDGYFSGTLTKGGGAFKIDHPLDPENKYLYHSFVESPDMMNVYNGNVILDDNGEARVTMPEWFNALNKDYRYQLTCIGGFSPVYIAQEITGNTFVIAGGKPGMKVSWMVTGIRQDAYANANRIPVEEDKQGIEAGTYIHPEAHGQTMDRSLTKAQAIEMGHEIYEQR